MRAGVVPTACVAALAASVVLAGLHPFGNASAQRDHPLRAPLTEGSSIPPEVRGILNAKCADCHSMETRMPIYGKLAPISWLVERDIVEGRKHMNLSLWDNYTPDQQQDLKAEIAQQTKTHQMPLLQYRVLHWNARPTEEDLRILGLWARGDALPATASAAMPAGEGDPLVGKSVFEKRCSGCHAMEQDHEGPRLQGVFGRVSGTVPGFPYSAGLKKAHIVWDDKSLDQWLADPDSMVPDNNMEFHVAKPDERRDLIEFLKKSSGK